MEVQTPHIHLRQSDSPLPLRGLIIHIDWLMFTPVFSPETRPIIYVLRR